MMRALAALAVPAQIDAQAELQSRVVTRALGFRPDSTAAAFDGDETVVSDIVLGPAVNELPTVAVREAAPPPWQGKMAAFDGRKALGVGHFIDSDVLEADNSRRLGDILASRVSGVTVHHGGASKAWVASRCTTSGDCPGPAPRCEKALGVSRGPFDSRFPIP